MWLYLGIFLLIVKCFLFNLIYFVLLEKEYLKYLKEIYYIWDYEII